VECTFLKEIWRYPVKSLAGEQLGETSLTDVGVGGDRRIVIVNGNGRVVTARRYPRLLALKGSLGKEGIPLVQGRPWHDPGSLARVREATGLPAEFLEVKGKESFDVLPLSVATDGAVDYLGVDRRRFRPNLLIGGVPGLAERTWEGSALRIGRAIIRMAQLRGRCVMTTWDPDTQVQDLNVLRRIVKELDGTLSLDSFVEQQGTVRVGDKVEVIHG
jgi:MOSC domain-containing protein